MIVNSGNISTLYTGFHAAFMVGFGQAPVDHAPFTLDVGSQTRTQEYGFLGQFPGMREWIGERVLRGIDEHGYAIRNRKFESTIAVSRDDIEDDHYGVYTPMFSEMGRSAAAHPCEMVYETLKGGFATACYDGQYFFDSDHPVDGASVSNTGGGNGTAWYLLDCSRMLKPIIFQRRRDYHMQYMDRLDDEQVFNRDEFRYGVDARVNAGYGLWQLAYGSKQALTAENYGLACEAMMAFKGDQGRPLGIMPTHLVVPPSLKVEAYKIVKAMYVEGGDTNIFFDDVTVIVSPWLA